MNFSNFITLHMDDQQKTAVIIRAKHIEAIHARSAQGGSGAAVVMANHTYEVTESVEEVLAALGERPSR